MHRPRQHPNNPDYDWAPADDFDNPVPADLVQYHREFKHGYWGYVCPCCRNVFAPGWAGMPESFRTHVREYLTGSGCFFNAKNKPLAKAKHADKDANF